MNHKKLRKFLITAFIAVIVSGFGLHIVSDSPEIYSHPVWAWWAWLHSLSALALTIAAISHILRMKMWFKSLAIKSKAMKLRFRKVDTLMTGLLMLVLFITGVIMVVGIDGGGSGIGMWHYVVGCIWIAVAVPHLRLFKRNKN